MIARILLTLILLTGWGWMTFGWNLASGLESGRAAGDQLAPSDAAYYGSNVALHFWSGHPLTMGLLLAALLVLIWLAPLRRLFVPLAAVGVVLARCAAPQPASAFYSKNDYTEAVIIGPSESAFWVPDNGNNVESQKAFDSAAYLDKTKIASKQFLIPHYKLSNSGGYYGWDYYVPSGRLYIVDRAPYTREWVDSPERGTSGTRQGFPCQSNEGIDVTVGVTISTSVAPADAAKFLYHYGTHPFTGDREDPNVIFRSVWYGRSLTEVMDTNVRNAIQALVCEEMTKRTLDRVNSEANKIMEDVKAKIIPYLQDKGITLEFVGWADTFTFPDPQVQDIIDRHYAAGKQAEIARVMAPYAQALQQLAVAEALRSRWNGKTPDSVSLTFLPGGLMDVLGRALAPLGTPAAPAQTAPAK